MALELINLHTINNIAKAINGRIEGDPNLKIRGVCDIIDGKSNKISYILSEKYISHIDNTKAAALDINNATAASTSPLHFRVGLGRLRLRFDWC